MTGKDAASLLLKRSDQRVTLLRAALAKLRAGTAASAQSHQRLAALLNPPATEEPAR
ncbi:hypothetical protein ACWEFL_02650 [Streptomyces sp. NPDC004838]